MQLLRSGTMRQACASLRRRAFSTRKLPTVPAPETEEWGVFPNEWEGNEYLVNWSLTYDGIVSAGDAFHNARLQVLTNRLSAKVVDGKVEVSAPHYYGDSKTLEAGENISFEDFDSAFSAQKEYFSSGVTMFVEDQGLGSFSPYRLGTRVVTTDAATALIFRSLLIRTPSRPVDHRARFDGWNYDDRWNVPDLQWDGVKYNVSTVPSEALPGQRPLLAAIGGDFLDEKSAAIQFVEVRDNLVGANVSAGSACSVLGIVDAIGNAYCGTLNEKVPSAAALASLTMVKGKDTGIVIGAPDEFIQFALSKNILYGAYHNVLSATGTSAVWNGAVAPAGGTSGSDIPSVVVKGSAIRVVNPNNLAFSPSSLFFYEAGAKKSTISPADAVKRLIATSGEDSKVDVFTEIAKNAKNIAIVGSTNDLA